jgi:tetratricopeptide (TPR) repeat protein
MKPRAFVIMPFGERMPVGFGPQEMAPAGKRRKIDFDLVYKELFEPALFQAGFEVVRADSEVAAGDIRTDMFFELVTADLVVADISILNANVFYELGIRHGVCPRGVFIVNGNVMPSRPFDVAPDRSFSYEASLFTEPKVSCEGRKARLRQQADSLAKRFRIAVALDGETIGSPVYSHLPGLKPVNWEEIDTSKARYFSALQDDWLDCVRNAQANGYPGDILTLAMNAPTRWHEARILYEAAMALINLGRYAVAEPVLRDVIRLDPAQADAQVQLALVLSRLDKPLPAEHQLRKILQQHKDDPKAADLLGQVFRHLWHLSWQKEHADRREKAKEASDLAISAIHRFSRAHRSDPKAYFAGYNALMLAYVLKEIGVMSLTQGRVASLIDFQHLKAVVRYAAENERQEATEEGDYVQQFWCTTTLAGLLLIDGKPAEALTEIREACAIPAATSFQLQSFQDRMELLEGLEVQPEFVQPALKIVKKAIGCRNHPKSCERVFLWSGYAIDEPKRPSPRFPSDRVEVVTTEIRETLQHWDLKSSDLGICGGTTESDIIFAETCLRRGARVRIMMREPVGSETSEPLWPFASDEWRKRFHELLRPDGHKKEIWIDADHLGTSPKGSEGEDPISFAKRRQKQWLINTARMEAASAGKIENRPPDTPSTTGRLYGLFLWDGKVASDDPDDPSWIIREANEFEDYRGEVKVLSPIRRSRRAFQPSRWRRFVLKS